MRAATNDDDGGGGPGPAAAPAREAEARASRAREVPTLADEDRSFVASLCGRLDEAGVSVLEDELSRSLDRMSPRLLVALQMAAAGEGGFDEQMMRVGRVLRSVLDARLDSARRLLEELLRSGEIRRLDALIGRSAREGRLDTSFFQVLSVNMRDAAMNADVVGDGGGIGAAPISGDAAGAGANRLQVLQHVYTRCQEELEKNVPPGTGLLNKLLRTESAGIRDNQLRHYLGPQATSITSPDGKVIELPNAHGKPLVSHVEFVDAISDAVRRLREVERAGGTDRLSAVSLVEDVRRIAAEARTVLASVHGEGGDIVVEFQEGLQPVFRPSHSSSAAAPSATAADPASAAAAQ